MNNTLQRDLVVIHSSDLHLGTDSNFSPQSSDPMTPLRQVLQVAEEERADLVLLAGDTFDHNSALGFIALWGLPVKTQAQAQLLKDGKSENVLPFENPLLLG